MPIHNIPSGPKPGGKGNHGMFTERDPKVCAAGIPSSQPDESVAKCLQHHLLKDEVDALISDALFPPSTSKVLPPLRRPIPLDTRHGGTFSSVAQLINPPNKTKFQTLVEDFKSTVYSSYWKQSLGQVPDQVPLLPNGLDIYETTLGKRTPYHGRLYDIVMPKKPYPDMTPQSKQAGVQMNRNYCAPAYNPDFPYGHKTNTDKRGTYARCCITDDRIILGNANRSVINSTQSNFQETTQPRCGSILAPNNNIKNVPDGYSFGILKPPDNLPECLTTCKINPDRDGLRKYLKGLNTLRKCLKTRFPSTFFHNFYLDLKYFDEEKTGWLPKDVLYKFCATKFIRFDPALIEPLLSMWGACDGSNIEYRTFVRVIDHTEPSPEMPKVPDVPDDCIHFETTYTDMVKPDQEPGLNFRAGLPSGRYFDADYPVTPEHCCKADRICLPHESDMKSCLNPSVLTLLGVTHRDMYAKREPDIVRRVFEAGNDKFTDEQFNTIWIAAKQYHSQGWVCYETFRRALEQITNP